MQKFFLKAHVRAYSQLLPISFAQIPKSILSFEAIKGFQRVHKEPDLSP
jgi:hypothetical protein